MKLNFKFNLKKLFLTILVIPMLIGVSTYTSNLINNIKNNSQSPKSLLNPNINPILNNNLSGPDYTDNINYENSNIIADLFRNIESYFNYGDATGKDLFWKDEEKNSFLKAFPLIFNLSNNSLNFANLQSLINTSTTPNDKSFLDAMKIYASDPGIFPMIIETNKFTTLANDGRLFLTNNPLVNYKIILGTFINWIYPSFDPNHQYYFHSFDLNFLYPKTPDDKYYNDPPNERIGIPLVELLNNIFNFITDKISSTQLLCNVFLNDYVDPLLPLKISGKNDFLDTIVFKFFISLERDFEARYLSEANIRTFNIGVLERYIQYDDWYGDKDKDHPEYEKLYSFYRRITDPTGQGILNFKNPQFGLTQIIQDFNKYLQNIVSKQPNKVNDTAWGTLVHEGKDYDPSKVLGSISKFNTDIANKSFKGITDTSVVTIADISSGIFPVGSFGVSKFSDYLIYKYENAHDQFSMITIYSNIVKNAYYYNNKGADTVVFPDQVFVIDYIFILWIILPFIIIGVVGIIIYLNILFKTYIPVKNQIQNTKNIIDKNRQIKINKKIDAKDTY